MDGSRRHQTIILMGGNLAKQIYIYMLCPQYCYVVCLLYQLVAEGQSNTEGKIFIYIEIRVLDL